MHSILALLNQYLVSSSKKSLGVPIGAVQLPKQHAHSFRLLLQDVFEQQVYFRGVDKTQDHLLIHLPPFVALSLDDNHHPQLAQFLEESQGNYLPGVRRQCPTHNFVKATSPKDCFTFVELFAGIGGFRVGLESIGGHCVLANEVNPDAATIYQQNFVGHNCLAVGDILDLASDSIPDDLDGLVGGFPCQSFSTRGTQKGLEDDRGQLYRELARILQDRQPKWFLFENVPGLVTLQGGSRTVSEKGKVPTFTSGAVFDRILETFRSCGYQVDWKVLNSRKWLPQMRERVYIVGTRDNLKLSQKMDWDALLLTNLEDESPITVRDILEPKNSPSVLASVLTKQQFNKLQKRWTHIDRMIDLDGKAPTLISRYHSVSSTSTKLIMEEADGTVNEIPRFLTPRECTRLMGFPEDFIVPDANDEVAVSQYYQAIGNAVCPIAIASIGKELIRCLEGNDH